MYCCSDDQDHDLSGSCENGHCHLPTTPVIWAAGIHSCSMQSCWAAACRWRTDWKLSQRATTARSAASPPPARQTCRCAFFNLAQILRCCLPMSRVLLLNVQHGLIADSPRLPVQGVLKPVIMATARPQGFAVLSCTSTQAQATYTILYQCRTTCAGGSTSGGWRARGWKAPCRCNTSACHAPSATRPRRGLRHRRPGQVNTMLGLDLLVDSVAT